jgi:gliding motility-associated-like protein
VNLPFLSRSFLGALVALVCGGPLLAQTGPLPTAGNEFWMGFMQNAYGTQGLRLQIAAQSATTGMVSIPLSGWSTPFSVAANTVITVTIPNTTEHTGGDAVNNKGIHIESSANITVTAVNLQNFSTDGTQVMPVNSLGTSYRVEAYRGLPGFADFYKSELLIVATQDGTEVSITPTVNTSGGHAAGVPYTVNLNAGQSYQVQSALASLDLTGTLVEGTVQSGSCRPFAVFGGSMCANVPVGCSACDHICEQMVPTDKWGTLFHTVPFGTTTQYTYRILAHSSGTQVSIDGAAPFSLSAGQKYEVNGATDAVCITSDVPISVVEFMEGFNCANKGDPSMVELLPDERTSTSVTFTTVASAQVNSHSISVVMVSADIGQLTLDGSGVNASFFQPYTGCTGYSVGVIPISVGTHTLAAINGFLAYSSGTGVGESYALVIGNVAAPVLPPTQVICSSDPITLNAPLMLASAQWTSASAPNTILATGSSYTFTPTGNDTYIVDGAMPVSGCPVHQEWAVGVPVPLVLDVTANGLSPTSICQFADIQLNSVPSPDPNIFDLQWTPAGSLSDATIPDPIAQPMSDTWFRLLVTSPVGCGQVMDSVFVNVEPSDLIAVRAVVNDGQICAGESITLQAQAERSLAYDQFENATSALWANIQGGALSNACGAMSGTALRFDGGGARMATTTPLNMTTGANLRFAVRIANGTAPCDDAEPGDDVLLSYSLDGTTWTTITTLNEASYAVWTELIIPIPAAALSATTRFRWSQPVNSGAGNDVWALDDVIITQNNNTGITFAWTPAAGLTSPNAASTQGMPTSNTTYTVTASTGSGCSKQGTVTVQVAPAFDLSVTNNTTVCTAGTAVPLQATPSSGAGITYAWTPVNGTLSSTTNSSTTATPTSTATYSVTATTDIGCTDNANVTITVGQLQSIDVAASDLQLCSGESSVLTATVVAGLPYALAWTPANGTLTSLSGTTTTATPTTTTTYTATITETASGCALSDAITVNASPAYSINAGPDLTICNVQGHQLNVVHNVPSPNILWTPAALLDAVNVQSPTIQFDTTATYHVTVTDAFGCSAGDSVTITDPFDTMITPINMAACEGNGLLLDAGFPGSTYDWSTNATTQMITVNVAGTYVCTITDAQGCQAVKTYFVTLNPLPVLDLGADTALCGATSFVVNANSPGNNVLWSTNATTQQITLSQSGTYSVTATSPQGCQLSDQIHVDFNPLPVDVLQDVTTCISQPPTLDAGNVGCAYAWSTAATTQSIVPSTSNTYSVDITTPQGCTATHDAVVTLMPQVVIDLGPDTSLCMGQPLLLDAGTPGLTYAWTTNATTQTIAPTVAGNYGVSASNGYCTGADDIQVTFRSAPVDALVDATACVDQLVTLDAGNDGCTYLWSTNATTREIGVGTPGTYTVTVTNSSNCSATFDATVSFLAYPVVDLGQDTVLCEGEVLQLSSGQPGLLNVWNTGQTSATIEARFTYTYVVSVSNGFCVTRDSLLAVFNPRPTALSTGRYLTCLTDEPHYVVIDAGNEGSEYDWSTGESSQVILAGSYGWYYVSMVNQYNCARTDSAVVEEFCPPSIYVPNTFTPNGDGVNDMWNVVGKNIGEFQMLVFDRWGGVIFQSDSPSMGWDGTYNGQPLKDDVYVWRMSYKFREHDTGKEGFEHKEMGHVTILR